MQGVIRKSLFLELSKAISIVIVDGSFVSTESIKRKMEIN